MALQNTILNELGTYIHISIVYLLHAELCLTKFFLIGHFLAWVDDENRRHIYKKTHIVLLYY